MKRLWIALVVVVVIAAFGLLSSIATQGYRDLARARAERARLEARAAELEARIAELEAMLAVLASDPAAMESLARAELGWVKPGETVILLATPTPPALVPSNPGPTPTPVLRMPP